MIRGWFPNRSEYADFGRLLAIYYPQLLKVILDVFVANGVNYLLCFSCPFSPKLTG
jgi:hypothetical protein